MENCKAGRVLERSEYIRHSVNHPRQMVIGFILHSLSVNRFKDSVSHLSSIINQSSKYDLNIV